MAMSSIAWLVPSLLEGSGGHRTILQHADYLQRRGHHCVLYMENTEGYSSATLRRDIKQMFGYEFADVRAGWSPIEPSDMIFATIWYSARVVRDLAFPCRKTYFVQDYEAQFNPVGDGYLMAENSYRYGLYPIAIGRWLPALLAREFNLEASYFDFCADLSIYGKLAEQKENAVCFIFQPEKPRRCAELGIEALGIVRHFMPDVKIYLYGSRASGKVWFEHTHLGLLDLQECNRLYNRCSVGLCISSTNPSRIPFEMMAAGLPVVEVFRDNTLYDFPEDAVLLCEQTPESIARGLMEILEDPARSARMAKAGSEFMKARPLTHGLDQFGDAVEILLTGNRPKQQEILKRYRRPALVAPAARYLVNAHQACHPDNLPDRGRLAFLPIPLRKVARAIYHRIRRLAS